MDDPILFNPDNRLLGGATGDLSLYGGQTDPQFSIHQARDDAPISQEPGTGTGQDALASVGPEGQLALLNAGGAPAVAPTQDAGAGSLAPSAFLIAPSQIAFEPVFTSAPATGTGQILSGWNPAPQGAGSPIPVLDPAEAALPPSEPDAIADNAAALADGMTAAPIMVAGTAAALLDELAEVPATASTLIAPIADALGSAVEATTGAVDDTLDGLAGSDPLGGVATLVNLVSVSDMFDLNPVDASLPETAGDSGLGLVDALVGGELLPDTLLGTHQDDGLLGGDHLDHPLGL